MSLSAKYSFPEWAALPTERRNPRTDHIDELPTLGVLELLNDEDSLVAAAVRAVLPQLAAAVDLAEARVHRGGQVHYFGAGTSGRLAVLDAAELLPTFNAPAGLVVAHHAGGPDALVTAVEDVEDDVELGHEAASTLGEDDVALGVTASGRTPYVAGALAAARSAGAATVLVTADPGSELAPLADVLIAPVTGPEAITGSTRLKAGSAQKLVLNSFSTALMVRLGRTWSNLMVEVSPTNAKLRRRTLWILEEATGQPLEECRRAFSECGSDLKTTLVHLLTGESPEASRAALVAHGGRVSEVTAAFGSHVPLPPDAVSRRS